MIPGICLQAVKTGFTLLLLGILAGGAGIGLITRQLAAPSIVSTVSDGDGPAHKKHDSSLGDNVMMECEPPKYLRSAQSGWPRESFIGICGIFPLRFFLFFYRPALISEDNTHQIS